ncbi:MULTISPECIES: HAMP domain-containing sensor histidine kinase [unclassified Clostridioides]|uniref:HAMP domain-containing sensor histidine kinase n=1 Tax=unclassified Clostridioides TaxID=2635829 RepID=UPI001D0C7280|nr:PAS domain-containing protein [Clostridioides sp. ES-S-0001-02]MCC0656935.1 PAS domain-containing protein [Clostridioides sp. ES-S-0123-01]MCC0672346.1 PAS domain-containing protein [Clostridioides sp. ES-S-0145-01]MCC0701604.1 PAS domain-containing protein [Clostridioides sp. ES-S-0049-02]MCC0761459.1 PAS domain-containing protein [Clostridioides sp. ES-S-0006-03]UDN59451.1 PAS domain-containing protein [Clostridioides sp. ES-S-0010-02]UDN61019.1 PAS domain-containing protein [Clostridioi
MEELNSIYFFIVMLSIAIVILSVRYTVTLRKYLKEFIYVSKKVSNKEFHARLNISAKGELGELARNFNHMIKNMDDTLEEVQYKHLQLRSILKSISHGILAIDVNGNILLINDEAKEMIKSEPNKLVEGHNINAVIKEEEILKQILQFIGSKENETAKITTKDDIVYKIKVDPVYLQNTNNVIIGSIVNIEDITKKVKLENMRSDFVANVSHELKTPLTSISGFVETLKSNENIDANTRNRFLEIIESESDRLKRLIDDILLLSFVENKDTLLMEDVVIYDVFREVYEITQRSASEKNIEVLYKCDDKSINILSNRDYIKQVFLNLVDNAIKYTQDNGIVQVVVLKDEEKIIIKVIDNGVGIPKEDVERIFERFYRVDKARSRDVGGTGLGLAITKHIVKSLNGCIKVKSELGIGSEFIVTILQKNFLK